MTLSPHEILIDEINMNFVQNLITSVNESKLTDEEKAKMRKTLDRWQNALMLTNKIRVTF
jgi:hypothetical protein